MRQSDIKKLEGEVITHIDIDPENDIITITTKSKRSFSLHHNQCCCEYVRIVGYDGEIRSIYGKPVVVAEHSEEAVSDCQTNITITLKTDRDTLIFRWIGESNGYYSESVDISEIAPVAKGK